MWPISCVVPKLFNCIVHSRNNSVWYRRLLKFKDTMKNWLYFSYFVLSVQMIIYLRVNHYTYNNKDRTTRTKLLKSNRRVRIRSPFFLSCQEIQFRHFNQPVQNITQLEKVFTKQFYLHFGCHMYLSLRVFSLTFLNRI